MKEPLSRKYRAVTHTAAWEALTVDQQNAARPLICRAESEADLPLWLQECLRTALVELEAEERDYLGYWTSRIRKAVAK